MLVMRSIVPLGRRGLFGALGEFFTLLPALSLSLSRCLGHPSFLLSLPLPLKYLSIYPPRRDAVIFRASDRSLAHHEALAIARLHGGGRAPAKGEATGHALILIDA